MVMVAEEEGGGLITVVVVAVVLMAELLEVCVLLGIAKKEKTRFTKYNWFVFVFFFREPTGRIRIFFSIRYFFL